MNNGGNIFLDVLMFLFIFGAILLLAYITTRVIAGKASSYVKGKYIEIIETVSLGVDKKIHLVRVDKQFILIATSGKNIEFLTSVTLESYEGPEKRETKNNIFDFRVLLDKYMKSIKSGFTGEKNEREVEQGQGQGTFKQNLFGINNLMRRLSAEKRKGEDENTNEKS